MSKKEIIKLLKLAASLMEIHGENDFKIRGYSNAVFNLERFENELEGLSLKEIAEIEGIGKSMSEKIAQMLEKGTFDKLEELKANTPEGLLEVVDIKGLGPKKIRVLWKDLNICSLEDLQKACESNQISTIKGFGQKTQDNILKEVNYILANKFKLLYADAETLAEQIKTQLENKLKDTLISEAGELRRKMEIVGEISFVIGTNDIRKTYNALKEIDILEHTPEASGPLNWRRKTRDRGIDVHFSICPKEKFYNKVLLHTGSEAHLALTINEQNNLFSVIQNEKLASEADAYEAIDFQYVEPEMREGLFEIALAKEKKIPQLLEYRDLKGTLHNHTTYSDGQNSLRQMAEKCIELGYEYLGISDHSKTAFYAGGLQESDIIKQHKEIEVLNKELAPFKIFKGIESDILNDGALDYDNDVLSGFDFIVASIHSPLNMDINKATNRLLKAINNPYTTILGHSTGRLLLRREGYPIDHKTVIDACVENEVIIEINANPWRLDLDWRWVNYALEKGALLSVNPDAHIVDGFEDMYYGVLAGRKGGLTKDKTFNCFSLAQVEEYFNKRKVKKNLNGK